MKRRKRQMWLSLGIAIFSLLLFSSQYDASDQIPFLFDFSSIENSGEDNPLADGQNGERLFAPSSSHDTSFAAVALAEKFSYPYTPTLPHVQLGAILRC